MTVGRSRHLLGCALVGLTAPALAQTATTPPPTATTTPAAAVDTGETIIVTGLRASLDRAIAIKRRSDVIVDSIASEDLGKFPDTNVAEALQRIPGVAIDRAGGEGQFVTVRGFGPKFNTVLVNGRSFASENPGREFSFDLLAADLISGADIYKSSNAALQDGGIGATINIRTARPFDIKGQRIVAKGQVDYEKLSGKVTPEFFGLYSNTFADGRIGVLVSGSYQKRIADVNTLATNGYFRTDLTNAALPAPLRNVNFPQNYDQIADRENRERIGVTATVQARLADTLLLSVDGLYNKFTVRSQANSIGHFFSPSEVTSATLDANRTVTAFSQSANGHTDYINRSFNRPTKLVSAGANLDWKPTSLIDVSLDSSYSKAELNNGGNEIFAVIGFQNPVSFANGGVNPPSITAVNGFVDPTVGRAHFATREGSNQSEEIYEERLDATFRTAGGFVDALKAGLYYQDLTKNNTLVRSQSDVGCAYCGYATATPLGLLKPFNPGNFFNGTAGNFPRQWLAYDAETYFRFLESTPAANAQDIAAGRPVGTLAAFLAANNGYAAIPYPNRFTVKEKVYGGYLQVNFAAEVGGLPLTGNLGARYTHTQVRSAGFQQALLDLLPIPGDVTSYRSVSAQTATPLTQSSSYDDFLPSLNLKLGITPDIDLRFAASRTVTRPDLNLLAPRVTFTNTRPGNLQASGGNPNLKPYKSTNFDLTGEWYFMKGSFLTLSGYYKQVSDFIVVQPGSEQFAIANAGNLPEFASGFATFNVSRPRNIASLDVYGLEVAFQHTLSYLPSPFDGLGVTANATFVGSNGGLNANNSAGATLEGLGDTYNATLFYEKGPVQARIAYTRRDKFLYQASDGNGEPVNTLPNTQVDAQVAFAVTSYATVFAEGINLFDERVSRQGRYSNQFLLLQQTGPRYAIGARLNF